jgi:bifunctional NMN adenylyltransferase/nudix hydrolase
MIQAKSPDGNLAVIVGRFQVHELHEGHRELFNWAYENYAGVMVVLGCPAVRFSHRNPIPWTARAKMIETAYPETIITHIQDSRSNENWSNELDKIIEREKSPRQKPVLIGSRDSFIPYYSGKYPTVELTGKTSDDWSGTQVREKLMSVVQNSPDFRAGIVYATSWDYPRVIPTVDVALVEKNTEVYLVRKHGETQWRFPGGFCEPGSNYEEDAKRELFEEVGLIECSTPRYICSMQVDDWRYRSEDSKIRTTFFRCDYMFGNINIQDRNEIADVQKFEIDGEINIVPEHRDLLEALRKDCENHD